MKKIISLMTLIAAFISFSTPCRAEEQQSQNTKILIAYYSWSGNTQEVAEAIAEKTGGTLFRIETVQSYPQDYHATTEQAKKEINDNYRPALKTKIENIEQYDTIFIGSPNWWGTIAPAVSTFLETYNLTGKKVIPFITHGGGGEQNTIKDLTAQCKGCLVASDGWVGFSSRTLGTGLWLKKQGFKN